MAPGVSSAQFGALEVDARAVPWSSLTRLALEAGVFPLPYRPVTAAEIATMLATAESQALSGNASALADDQEYARLLWLLNRYKNGGGGVSWHGCECKTHPPHLRFGGRIVGGFSELGDLIPAEGGLGFTAGHSIFLEPSAEFSAGKFWAVFNLRIGGRVADGGVAFDGPGDEDNALTWPGWHLATGKAEVRQTRLGSGQWQGQVTRALVGLQLGRWALSAGWDQRRTGPGLTGDLNLDYQGRPFAALTARRTESFRWNGVMTHLAPDQLLLRVGSLSERRVTYHDDLGSYAIQARPWFFQWLMGWNVTPWFRTHFTHSVMATARDSTLWPDLIQINFPLIGTTWREMDSGPITDRIFAVQFEFRWRSAPWPVLPSSAGRLYWDYGGTDFLPSGPGGLVPQISLPASVAGIELLSPGWDLALEYAELRHDKVLWYTNGGYAEGYSHEQSLIGHALGGSGESVMGLMRIRPQGWGCQVGLRAQVAHWGIPGLTPGKGDRHSAGLTLRRVPGQNSQGLANSSAAPLLWEVTAEWNRESADPYGYLNFPPPDSEVVRDWWRLIFKVGI